MDEKLKAKLTERFAVIMKKSNLNTDKPLDDAVYDGMLKAYLAGGEYGYELGYTAKRIDIGLPCPED